MNKTSYGAKIKLIIEFEGDMEELCNILSNSLSIPEFWFDTISEPPYEVIAYCETLGFEIDIQKNSNIHNNYVFSAITTNSFQEIADKKMYDLSIWFSSYLKLVSKLEITVVD